VPTPKYVPKHRSEPVKPVRTNTRKVVIKNGFLMSGLAVAATGVAVSAGVLSDGSSGNAAVALSASGVTKPMTATELASREQASSRSSDDRRADADRIKTIALSSTSGRAYTGSENLADADPQTITKALMPQFGMPTSQFSCIDSIWSQESGWNLHAANPTSSAYGIPQALPGSKMASAGPDWQNNAETQIKWGLGYIKERYGSACSAWAFKSAHGWY
jgi:hypothetical protein